VLSGAARDAPPSVRRRRSTRPVDHAVAPSDRFTLTPIRRREATYPTRHRGADRAPRRRLSDRNETRIL